MIRYSEDQKDAARLMRLHGANYSEIATRFGTSASTARRWCDEEARQQDVAASIAWKRANPESDRQHAKGVRARAMQAHKYGTCQCGRPYSRASKPQEMCRKCRTEQAWRCPPCKSCGGEMHVGEDQYRKGAGLCINCVHEPARVQAQRIVDLYLGGRTFFEIEEIAGCSYSGGKATIYYLRRAGHPLPRRARGSGPVRWVDPMPTEPIRVEVGDIAAGVRGENVVAKRKAA